MECKELFIICLCSFGVILSMLAMFFSYSLRLKDKSIELEKKHEENKERCHKLEQKNGSEQRQINQLKQEIEELKKKQGQNISKQ